MTASGLSSSSNCALVQQALAHHDLPDGAPGRDGSADGGAGGVVAQSGEEGGGGGGGRLHVPAAALLVGLDALHAEPAQHLAAPAQTG